MRAGIVCRTLVMLGCLGSLMGEAPGSVGAQPLAPSGLTVQGVVEGDVVEGRVSRVDPRTRTITLDNGQEYLIPLVFALNWERVRTGAAVKMRYSVDGGRNVATAFNIQP